MVRRRIVEEPASRLAIWARRCALLSLAAMILIIIIVRAGLLEIVPAIGAVGATLALAGVGILLAIGAFVVIWREGVRGGGAAFVALAIGIAMLAYPAYLGIRGYSLPAINDVTTDPNDPPRLEVLARLRPAGTTDYPGATVAALQRAAYPDIEPLEVSASAQIAYEAAIAVITKRKWRIVVDRPPQANRRDGQIEAVARTPILGFRDDVVLRVRATRDGARIDVRSASRYGQHDFGSNASRIRSLLEEIDEVVSARSEERRPPPKPAPAKPQPTRR
jgi:uncharacterized protein (DUF1499 family)